MQAGSLVGLERHSQIERGYELGVEEYIILYLKFRRQTVPHLSLVLSVSCGRIPFLRTLFYCLLVSRCKR